MARVTLTIEGEPEEIREALRILLGAEGSEGIERGAKTQPTDSWTSEELAELFIRLSPGAQEVLAEIARRPQGYPNPMLQKALGLDGATIGGRLSSVGSKQSRFPGKPPLYAYDGYVYRMAPEVAQIMRKLAQTNAEKGEDA